MTSNIHSGVCVGGGGVAGGGVRACVRACEGSAQYSE